MTARPDVLIIGAGVIGLSIAHEALARGLTVTVIDREGPAAGASAGNAAAFAFTEIQPLASPATLLKSPAWLLDPLGPLSVPPRYTARIAPWMLRFAVASLPHRVARSTAAQAALMTLARTSVEPFMAATGTLPMLQRNGQIQVYETARAFDAARRACDAAARHGFTFRHLAGGDEIAAIQPGLAPRFGHAIFTPDWWSVADPKLYVEALAETFRDRGGALERAEARAISLAGQTAVLTTDGRRLEAGRIVLAAGAHSHRIARTIGDRIPLETERGYNTTLPPGACDLRCHITFAEHGFVASPLSTGIRIGGAVELGGLDLPPNFTRARAMLRKAADFLPGLEAEGGREWMGFRPSLPDTLPAIGESPRAPEVIHAFGHGHLGLTQSTATARIVADLLTGTPPPIDIAAFSPGRFRGLP
ncbi:D-amino acid dehydrogenase 1 [Defluviimonas aquaemixtae]|uniref:D-amino acid dehydrogenase 1 n=1 Tax=Albidovulum aquaemixtae TaxID=1542388 RepID=A0A2R8BJW5_9RHOB|nr:FAD-binding oxidoreductase [Defluviimonas aquaemixtae]SPH23675.1 D-amino acid dehydrogenase 1 [Defluviimonas aquaemixtae]